MSKRLLILLILLVTACGGGAATNTSADGGTDDTTTTTTTAGTEEETTNATVDLSDMPQECIDAFVSYLVAIEPVVDGFDFENATMDDMESIGTELEAATVAQTAEMESLNCPDVDATDEEVFSAMIDIAEREAPGTVAYFEWIQSLAATAGEGGGIASSGDCETDIETMEAVVAEKESMGNLTMTELTEFGQLMTAITTECSPARFEEFLSQPEIEAFMSPEG